MLLEIKSLTKTYGKFTALDGVTLSIAAGERVALLGANGSGKTTTVRSICRLLEWEGGDIYFEGQPIRGRKQYLAEIGAVLEGSRDLNWRLSAKQNALYFSGIRGVSDRKALPIIDSLMDRLGLSQYGSRIVARLSTGNRQKTALLCALVHQPKLLMLDEPTLGLDLQTMDELERVLLEIQHEGNQAMLITSHDLGFIDKVCTRVVLIDKGRVLFDGGIKDLRETLFQYELVLTVEEASVAAVASKIACLFDGEATRAELNGAKLVVQYNAPDAVMGLLAWLEASAMHVLDMTIMPLSLEKAYKKLLASEGLRA
ncbi:ABC transporter ATP-binding protein [Tahibacter sp.]|uniref:ABC transporter ATP-binding protein n=1 Tax=Tahibacter sp. TaxID=2056211 RepID=UPI0028C3E593|nr:ABC transporter ATP-binding protein [Tahibacter sp.]